MSRLPPLPHTSLAYGVVSLDPSKPVDGLGFPWEYGGHQTPPVLVRGCVPGPRSEMGVEGFPETVSEAVGAFQ